MSFAEASRRLDLEIGMLGTWPEETRVWLVVLAGRWQDFPRDLTQAPVLDPHQGCVYTRFAAGDKSLISMGDRACPAGP
jgi:hypothetical protein